jgi:peptide/nickel transport system substrate-binding protein
MHCRPAALLVIGSIALGSVDAAGQTVRFSPGTGAPTAYNTASGRYEEGSSFDPFICAEQPCGELLHNIFEGLVSASDARTIQPELATQWQRLDEVTFAFTLRRGVSFHNGEPFDAEAVRFSLMRASEAYGATAWFPRIARVDIVEPYVVKVTLMAPDSLFLYRLGHLALILPPRYFRQVGPAGFGANPVGTGAFRFVRWDKGKREVVLEANAGYWRARNPKVSRVVYSYLDAETALDRLTQGRIDLVRRLNPRKTTQFMETGRGKVVKAWLPQMVIGPFNLLKPSTPLKDRRVREAINLAIDREDVLRYGTIGNGRPIGGYTVPEDPNHAGLEPYPFDPIRARELLKAAGYPSGFKLSMLVSKEVPPQVEKIVAVSLAQIGVRVTIKEASEADFLKELFLPKFGAGTPPTFDILLLSVPVGTVSHSGYVPMTLLYSRKPNESAVRDAVLDDLYEQALRTYDAGRASVLWKKLERYVYDNHLLLVGYQERAVFGSRESLQFSPRTLMTFRDAYFGSK